uniref:EF-hand domain-containing protein n=1 Tax=Globisporangium ultimum (strain ATCC 200006 / CBS 805.95 / DAOM BR144) TaxID=431595 RepID=K3WYY7_GLOUD
MWFWLGVLLLLALGVTTAFVAFGDALLTLLLRKYASQYVGDRILLFWSLRDGVLEINNIALAKDVLPAIEPMVGLPMDLERLELQQFAIELPLWNRFVMRTTGSKGMQSRIHIAGLQIGLALNKAEQWIWTREENLERFRQAVENAAKARLARVDSWTATIVQKLQQLVDARQAIREAKKKKKVSGQASPAASESDAKPAFWHKLIDEIIDSFAIVVRRFVVTIRDDYSASGIGITFEKFAIGRSHACETRRKRIVELNEFEIFANPRSRSRSDACYIIRPFSMIIGVYMPYIFQGLLMQFSNTQRALELEIMFSIDQPFMMQLRPAQVTFLMSLLHPIQFYYDWCNRACVQDDIACVELEEKDAIEYKSLYKEQWGLDHETSFFKRLYTNYKLKKEILERRVRLVELEANSPLEKYEKELPDVPPMFHTFSLAFMMPEMKMQLMDDSDKSMMLIDRNPDAITMLTLRVFQLGSSHIDVALELKDFSILIVFDPLISLMHVFLPAEDANVVKMREERDARIQKAKKDLEEKRYLEHLKAEFRLRDTDGGGSLDVAEIESLLKSVANCQNLTKDEFNETAASNSSSAPELRMFVHTVISTAFGGFYFRLLDDMLPMGLPALEVSLEELAVYGNFSMWEVGKISFDVYGKYYNMKARQIEPFLEYYQGVLDLKKDPESHVDIVYTSDRYLQLNVTAAFMETVNSNLASFSKVEGSAERVRPHIKEEDGLFWMLNESGVNLKYYVVAKKETKERHFAETVSAVVSVPSGEAHPCTLLNVDEELQEYEQQSLKEKQLRQAFRNADKDGSGELDTEEVRAVLREVYEEEERQRHPQQNDGKERFCVLPPHGSMSIPINLVDAGSFAIRQIGETEWSNFLPLSTREQRLYKKLTRYEQQQAQKVQHENGGSSSSMSMTKMIKERMGSDVPLPNMNEYVPAGTEVVYPSLSCIDNQPTSVIEKISSNNMQLGIWHLVIQPQLVLHNVLPCGVEYAIVQPEDCPKDSLDSHGEFQIVGSNSSSKRARAVKALGQVDYFEFVNEVNSRRIGLDLKFKLPKGSMCTVEDHRAYFNGDKDIPMLKTKKYLPKFERVDWSEPKDIASVGTYGELRPSGSGDFSFVLAYEKDEAAVVYTFVGKEKHWTGLRLRDMVRDGVWKEMGDWSPNIPIKGVDEPHKTNDDYNVWTRGPLGDGPMVNIAVHMNDQTIFATLKDVSAKPSYRIENRSTRHSFRYVQRGVKNAEELILKPLESHSFVWDDPLAEALEVKITPLQWKVPTIVDFMLLGEIKNVTPNDIHGEVYIDESTRVLAIGDTRVFSGIRQQAFLSDWLSNTLIDLAIHGVGITIVDTHPQEVLNITMESLRFTSSAGSRTCVFTLHHIQMDDMTPHALYPVILAPLDSGFNSDKREGWLPSEDERPFFSLTIDTAPKTGIAIFNNFDMVVNSLSVKLNLEYVLGLVNLLLEFAPGSDEETMIQRGIDYKNTMLTLNISLPDEGVEGGMLLYFKKWKLSPFDFHLVFDSSQEDRGEGISSILGSTLGSIIGGIAHVTPEFHFGEIVYRNTFFYEYDLVYDVVWKIVLAVVGQWYKIVGSVEMLGDPVGLATEIVDGFALAGRQLKRDIRGQSLHKGQSAITLVQTVFGAPFGSIGKVSNGLGDVVKKATKFKSQESDEEPRHVPEGIFHGGVIFSKSIAYGVTGFVKEPVRGAKRGGVKGFAKGVGRGTLQLIVSPVVGTLGVVEKVAQSVSNTTHLMDEKRFDGGRRPARDLIMTPLKSLSDSNVITEIEIHCVYIDGLSENVNAQVVVDVHSQGGGGPTRELGKYKSTTLRNHKGTPKFDQSWLIGITSLDTVIDINVFHKRKPMPKKLLGYIRFSVEDIYRDFEAVPAKLLSDTKAKMRLKRRKRVRGSIISELARASSQPVEVRDESWKQKIRQTSPSVLSDDVEDDSDSDSYEDDVEMLSNRSITVSEEYPPRPVAFELLDCASNAKMFLSIRYVNDMRRYA